MIYVRRVSYNPFSNAGDKPAISGLDFVRPNQGSVVSAHEEAYLFVIRRPGLGCFL
jgi:hypothetical protein